MATCGAVAWVVENVSRPWLSGSDRSSSTMSNSLPQRYSRPSDSRPAWISSKAPSPASDRLSWSRRASPGLSSTSNTRIGLCPLSFTWLVLCKTRVVRALRSCAVGRQADNGDPELFDGLDHRYELLQAHRLGNVAVGVEVVGFNPNPPKDTDGRREDSGRGWVRELQGRWPGVLG